MTPPKLDLQSADLSALHQDALYEALHRIAPSCFTEVRDEATGEIRHAIQFDTLRTLLGDASVPEPQERYQFTWPGKQEARREAARPTSKTLRPVVEDSLDWEHTQNLYIEGDNLEVLKLLQRSYMGKVKMVYIDPPYNTGNDFVYRDNFARSAEAEALAAGDIDELGNRYRVNLSSNGRYHSDWCSMIYSRLMVARTLLSDDGVIFISIDDNEVHNLRKICDEIFGESNFVAEMVWERAFAPKNDAKYISNSHDYVLMFAKQIDQFSIGRLPRTEEANARYSNPDNDHRGVWMSSDMSVKTYSADCDYPIITPSGRVVEPPVARCWSLSKKAFLERLQDNRIWFGENGDGVPRLKRFLSELKHEGMAPASMLFYKEVGHSQEGAKEVKELMENGVFDGPKPIRLLRRLLTLANLSEDSIVMDFFSGSATTAHAVMQLNAEDGGKRRYICVQLPEETPEKSEARKAGYETIPEIAKERIRRAGKKIKEESPLTTQDLDTGFRVFRLDEGNFRDVSLVPDEYGKQSLDDLLDNVKHDRSDLDLLFGVMLSWGVQLSHPMSETLVDGKKIYFINEGDLVACFADEVSEAVLRSIADLNPLRVVFRDSCFGSDSAKINVYETLKQLMTWSDEEAMSNIKVI